MDEKVLLARSVIIHIAEPDHLPQVFQLVDTYCDELDIDRTIAKNSLRNIVYAKGVMLVEYEGKYVAGIAGLVLPGLFTNDWFFSTMFFYVVRGYRFLTREIIKEIELVLLPTKVNRLVIGIPNGENYDKQQRFMRMMGYKELETHMEKRI